MKNKYRIFLAFSMAVALLGCDSGAESGSAASEKKGYTLNDREKIVLRVILINEIETISRNGSSYPPVAQKLLGDYVVTTSANLQREYERNEVAGDQKFRGKTVLINGVVKSIDRSLGENYFISLKGGSNPFMEPKASMADGYTNFLAGLEKGDEVALICKGDGMLMGSAMVSNCEPMLNHASQRADNFIKKLDIEEAIANKDNASILLSIISVATASTLPDSSTCFVNDFNREKCSTEIHATTNKKDEDVAWQAALKLAKQKIGLAEFPIKDSPPASKQESMPQP